MSDLGNKEIMAQNIQRLMDKRGIDRNKICTDLGFKYTTFTDWVKGNTYPRIDKIEMMANYFGVSKSDLVERYDENKPYYANLEVTQFAQAIQNSPYANNLITSITDLSEEEMGVIGQKVCVTNPNKLENL